MAHSESPRQFNYDPEALPLGDALEKHHEMQRANNRREATINSHHRRLEDFINYLYIEYDIEETTEIEPKHFHAYKLHLSKQWAPSTVKTYLDTTRVFIRNLEEAMAVERNLHTFVSPPNLSADEERRSEYLDEERGHRIRDHLRRYEWGSAKHVCYELWWSTGIRIGSVHSLDEEDFFPDRQYIRLRHRPDTETTLKNGRKAERAVGITEAVRDGIKAYLEHPKRPDGSEDEHGRQPLLASPHGGRYHKTTLRDFCYGIARPCVTENGCPHDDIDEDACPAASNRNKASKCPSSKSPHALRSGAITRQLKAGIDPRKISERADVGLRVLRKHYDEMSEEERMEVRRGQFDEEYESKDADDIFPEER